MKWGARKSVRVSFERGYDVNIIAIDGTWRRACTMLDVSDTGARLVVHQSIEGLQIKEFFLVLAPTGRVYRRCELIRVNGDEIGVRFLKSQGQSRLGSDLGMSKS
jgi:hypothetical protein